MNRHITKAIQPLVNKLSRRHALFWLGGSGMTTAFVVGSQNEVIAKQNKGLEYVNPPGLYDAAPLGFSQIVVAPPRSRTVYISGQNGVDENGNLVSDDFAAQLKQSFVNLRIALDSVGARPEHVAKVTELIVNQTEEQIPLLISELKALFGEKLPANTLIPVPRLALNGFLFEIDAFVEIPLS